MVMQKTTTTYTLDIPEDRQKAVELLQQYIDAFKQYAVKKEHTDLKFAFDIDREDNETMFKELLADVYELIYTMWLSLRPIAVSNDEKLLVNYTINTNLHQAKMLARLFIILVGRDEDKNRSNLLKIMYDISGETINKMDKQGFIYDYNPTMKAVEDYEDDYEDDYEE